jgi:sterol desaturase/sphingolipid hydroxylase (fatty acid hydroxylase superfamily)
VLAYAVIGASNGPRSFRWGIAVKMTKLGYFAEFFLFPPLVFISTAFAFYSSSAPRPVTWAVVYGIGLAGWTLIEYLLHRVIFHNVPFLSQFHERHHDNPQELIGTPAWVSVLAGLIGVASPSWAILGFDLATAATAGMATGYLWFIYVHYATHHSRPGHGSYLYWARLRHARHHYVSDNGNFGVTTGVWDLVFGTALELRRPRRGQADHAKSLLASSCLSDGVEPFDVARESEG